MECLLKCSLFSLQLSQSFLFVFLELSCLLLECMHCLCRKTNITLSFVLIILLDRCLRNTQNIWAQCLLEHSSSTSNYQVNKHPNPKCKEQKQIKKQNRFVVLSWPYWDEWLVCFFVLQISDSLFSTVVSLYELCLLPAIEHMTSSQTLKICTQKSAPTVEQDLPVQAINIKPKKHYPQTMQYLIDIFCLEDRQRICTKSQREIGKERNNDMMYLHVLHVQDFEAVLSAHPVTALISKNPWTLNHPLNNNPGAKCQNLLTWHPPCPLTLIALEVWWRSHPLFLCLLFLPFSHFCWAAHQLPPCCSSLVPTALTLTCSRPKKKKETQFYAGSNYYFFKLTIQFFL